MDLFGREQQPVQLLRRGYGMGPREVVERGVGGGLGPKSVGTKDGPTGFARW